MSSVTLTESAKTRLTTFLRAQNETTAYFTVNSKGCGGNGYEMGVIDAEEIAEQDETIVLDEGLVFVIDGFAVPSVVGTVIDWSEDTFSGGFVFNNPQSVGSCGCGSSFSTAERDSGSCS
jgi:iron-sulfur cluster assembly protein